MRVKADIHADAPQMDKVAKSLKLLILALSKKKNLAHWSEWSVIKVLQVRSNTNSHGIATNGPAQVARLPFLWGKSALPYNRRSLSWLLIFATGLT